MADVNMQSGALSQNGQPSAVPQYAQDFTVEVDGEMRLTQTLLFPDDAITILGAPRIESLIAEVLRETALAAAGAA